MSGVFITFEGGEGAGKTTLIEVLFRYFSSIGKPVIKTREPGGTQLGEEIRDLLLQRRASRLSYYTELTLFLASRAQHILEVIRPALQEGKIVLCDRYNDSSVAYQGAARGLGTSEVAEFCRFATEDLVPDLTLYLDIDPEIGLKRAKNTHEPDRIEAEKIAFHQVIRSGYLEIAEREPERFHVLNGELPPEQVFHQALQLIKRLM